MKTKLDNLYRTNPQQWMWVILGIVTGALLLLGAIPVIGSIIALGWLVTVPWIIIKARKAKPQRTDVITHTLTNTVRPAHKHDKTQVVQIKYVNDINSDRAWCYEWSLNETPQLGGYVIVPGMSGSTPAIITGFGRTPETERMDLSVVERVATKTEFKTALAAAERQHAKEAAQQAKDDAAWFNLARIAVGLEPIGRTPTKTPTGYDEIPPTTGKAKRDLADQYGRVWWKLSRRSEEAGRETAEWKKFQMMAYRWFTIRDQADK